MLQHSLSSASTKQEPSRKIKLSVTDIKADENFTVDDILRFGVLASLAANNDSVDMAFLQKAADNKTDISGYRQISFTPFSAAIKRTEAIVEKDGKHFKVIKGAYNTIKSLCDLKKSNLDKIVDIWAAKRFKQIAVAIQRDNITTMVGIVALVDPPLSDSAKMIKEIKELGITVKMLTGDALPIAKEIASKVEVGDDIVTASLLRQQATGVDSYNSIIAHSGFAEYYCLKTNL